MAITYLEVNTGSLSSDANGMEEQIKAAGVSLTELTDELEALNAMWKGNANLAFRNQVNSDISVMADILDNMTALAESCKNAVREYNRCEAEVITEINTIKF